MYRPDFLKQMQRLSDQYGNQHYKTERLDLIYAQVKDIFDHQLAGIITDFLVKERYAPSPQQIIDACQRFKVRKKSANNSNQSILSRCAHIYPTGKQCLYAGTIAPSDSGTYYCSFHASERNSDKANDEQACHKMHQTFNRQPKRLIDEHKDKQITMQDINNLRRMGINPPDFLVKKAEANTLDF